MAKKCFKHLVFNVDLQIALI